MKRVMYSVTTLKGGTSKNKEAHNWAKLWEGYEFPTSEDFSDWMQRLRAFVDKLNDRYKQGARLAVTYCNNYQYITVHIACRLDSDIVRFHNCLVPFTYKKEGGRV